MQALRRPVRVMVILAAAAILIYAGLIIYVCVIEGSIPSSPEDTGNYDAVIVLGAQVRADSTPSVQLEWRLESALKAWEYHPVPVIVCGAQGKDEPRPEAEVMKEWLAEHGIPENQILTDLDSFNTRQNLTHAGELLKTRLESPQVLIVSSDYHVPRAMAMAADTGLQAVGLGSPCKPEYWLKNHAREALAWVKYWVGKLFFM